MSNRRDPVQVRDDGSLDLQNVVTWNPQSWLDALATAIYGTILVGTRTVIITLAVFILIAQLVLTGLGAIADPVIGAFTLLSAIPALILAIYVWYADVTTGEPLRLLVGTFVLGVLFAGFAGVLNPLIGAVVQAPFAAGESVFGVAATAVGLVVFFFLVVGPVEEGVKLLAVRLLAYRSDEFDAVVDGAVYGAVAGLGFATIENALYITQQTMGSMTAMNLLTTGGSIAAVRALAGPGHVIYSAFAGYYLGLAKFNPDNAGPIVIKGLFIAAVIHGAYNSLVSIIPPLFAVLYDVPDFIGLIAFVVVFDGLFILLLIRKLNAYRRAYDAVHEPKPVTSELTEFDP